MQCGHTGVARGVGEKRERTLGIGECIGVEFDRRGVECGVFQYAGSGGRGRLERDDTGRGMEAFGGDGMETEIRSDDPEHGAGAEVRTHSFENFGFIETLLDDVTVNAVAGDEVKFAAVAGGETDFATGGRGLEP